MTRALFIFVASAALFACSEEITGGPTTADADRASVLAIFDDFDDFDLSVDQQLEIYADDAVLLAPDAVEVRGRAALRAHIAAFRENDGLEIDHQLVEFTAFPEVVVAQGRVVGRFNAPDYGESYPFETKNLILFRRDGAGGLKVWKVIYNAAPVSG